MSHNTQKHDTPDEPLSGRYASAVGFDPNKKDNEISAREIARKKKRIREKWNEQAAMRSAIEIRPAPEWLEYPEPLPEKVGDPFPPYWREGQLAVLTGPSGVGKSLLAVQIAESIAGTRASTGVPAGASPRGVALPATPPTAASPSSLVTHPSSLAAPRQVLLLDLAHTERQLVERYTHGEERYEFSERLEWGMLGDMQIPDSFRGSTESFLRGAVFEKLADTDASVVIIDDLSWLTRSGTGTELRQLMKTFRRWVNQTGRSLLLIAHDNARRVRSPHVPGWQGKGHSNNVQLSPRPSSLVTTLSEFSNSIFQLSHSTFAPEYRYVKALKSGSPPAGGGVAPASGDEVVGDRVVLSLHGQVHVYKLTRAASPSLSTVNSQLSVDAPFLGFEPLGTAPEELHTRDYAADVRKIEKAIEREENRRRLSAKESLAEAITDGSYAKYLLND
jgi:hypothetical protein